MEDYLRLEKEFSSYVGTRCAVAANTGTAALHLVFAALGFGPGDEVLVPEFTYVSTAWAVTYTGAKPVFYRCLPDLSPDFGDLESKRTIRTKAVVAAHIYGIPVDVPRMMRIGLPVVEDCCEAHGAQIGNRKVGSVGRYGCFSFQSSKIVNGEEGGMVTTNDERMAERMRSMRSTANDGTYRHSGLAFNYRMPNATAALALRSFKDIGKNLKKRRKIWETYDRHLSKWSLPWKEGQVAWVYPVFRRLPKNIPFAREFFKSMGSQPMYGGGANTAPVGSVLSLDAPHPEALAKKVANYLKLHG